MIVVADSGSTKTEWRLCSHEKIHASTSTIGLNPLAFAKESSMSDLLGSEMADWTNKGVEGVYFYGAGFVNARQRELASNNLGKVFKTNKVVVNSDLLGAARAAFGNNAGIIGILGTGSNSGLYDGKKITNQIPPLGYILGDEGSGAVMSKNLIRSFLRSELPEEIESAFKIYYPEYDSLIEEVYSQSHASRFLGSFVPFLYDHRENKYIKDLLLSELNKFVKLIRSYQGHHKIGIVGSVGFQFKTELNLLARNAELKIVDYLKSPIDKLAIFHQSKLK